VRPALDRLEVLAEHDDELVLAGTDEVFRLPLAPSALARQAVLVRALPVLRLRLPVAVAPPRLVGLLPDGATPFTAERRLPGTARSAGSPPLGPFAAGQLAGVLAAPIYSVNPQMGSNLIIIVFAVVVIGGMGSILGSVVTGFGLGIIEGLTKVFYPEASATVIFVVMAIVLLARPAGLFGRG